MKTNMKIQNTSSNTPVDSNANNSISHINKAPQVMYEEEDDDDESVDVDFYDMPGEQYILGNMHNDDKAIYI